MSIVWKYFTVTDPTDEIAECQLCHKGLKRGPKGCPKVFSTTPLHKHLQAKHPNEYSLRNVVADVANHESASRDPQPPRKQRKLAPVEHYVSVEGNFNQKENCDRNQKEVWSVNDPRALDIHQKVMRVIAIDNQPFSVVEGQGFVDLLTHLQPRYKIPSRQYFEEVMLPKTYENVRLQIVAEINPENAPHLSFTSDIWTSPSSAESFMSLTCHWITKEYKRRNAVLLTRHFADSPSSENIDNLIPSMMSQWGITDDRQHIIVCNGGANMTSGKSVASIESVQCFLHILNCVVKEAILSQKVFCNIRAKVRYISNHLNDSSLGQSELEKFQTEEGIRIPVFPVEDVSTRWNTTYLMLERALTLKREIYTAEHDVPLISVSEWDAVERLIRVLQPFYEITKQVSSKYSTLSDVIPHVVALKRYLMKTASDAGIIATNRKLLSALENYLLSTSDGLNILNERSYVLTTFLDPRYKLKFMKEKGEQVKSWLLDEVRSDIEKCMKESESNGELIVFPNNTDHTEDANNHKHNIELPPKPMYILQEEIHREFLRCYSEDDEEVKVKEEVVEEKEEEDDVKINCAYSLDQGTTWRPYEDIINTTLTEIAIEIDEYASSPTAEREQDPVEVWKEFALLYPTLSRVARKYLSCPASPVYCDKLFCEAGGAYEERRASQLPRSEELLFLNLNLPHFKLTDPTI